MANKTCINRLQKEYRTLLKEPVPHITSHPSPTNLLEWHFVLEGATGTEFAQGVYHGKIVFPPSYPFKPPSISLFTPNGRFATNTKLCLSMTDFHPESWNPMWSVGTILAGLLSFMSDTQQTTGSIVTSRADKEAFAAASLAFNVKNPAFRKLFPEWVETHTQRLAAAEDERLAAAAAATTGQQEGHTAGPSRGAGGEGALHHGAGGRAGPSGHGDAAGGREGREAPAAGGGLPGSFLFTAAVVALLLAIVMVPLFSGRGILSAWWGAS